MNVSLRETGCLKKTLNILFSSCLCIMHIKPPGVEASTCGLSHISFMNAKITIHTQSVVIVQIRIRYNLIILHKQCKELEIDESK